MIEDVVGKILIDLGVDYVENNSSYDISCPFHTSDSSSTTLIPKFQNSSRFGVWEREMFF